MIEILKLTRAQVRWIENRACSLYETHTWGSALEQAIHELTAKPGEKPYCQDCEWWGYESRAKYCVRDGVISVSDDRMGWGCNHPDARDSFCPIDRWGDKGGER